MADLASELGHDARGDIWKNLISNVPACILPGIYNYTVYRALNSGVPSAGLHCVRSR